MTKYHAQKTQIDGIIFDSKAEAARYSVLACLERNGDIEDLRIHPVFPLVVNDQKIGKYIADFSYIENGREIVEDVKGVKTPVYRLKKKLVKAIYGFDILEIS
jgi:hypothetical protein